MLFKEYHSACGMCLLALCFKIKSFFLKVVCLSRRGIRYWEGKQFKYPGYLLVYSFDSS